MPLKEALEKEGFEVALYDYATMERGEISLLVQRI